MFSVFLWEVQKARHNFQNFPIQNEERKAHEALDICM